MGIWSIFKSGAMFKRFFTTATNTKHIVEELIKAHTHNIESKANMLFDSQDICQYLTFHDGANWFRDNYLYPLLDMNVNEITLDLLKSIE